MGQLRFSDETHGAGYVTIVIRGDTFPHRELLHELGFRFNDDHSGPHWYYPRGLYRDSDQFRNVVLSTKRLADISADVTIILEGA